jgi:hypothetical protein
LSQGCYVQGEPNRRHREESGVADCGHADQLGYEK